MAGHSPPTQRCRLPLAKRPDRAIVWHAEAQTRLLAGTEWRTTSSGADDFFVLVQRRSAASELEWTNAVGSLERHRSLSAETEAGGVVRSLGRIVERLLPERIAAGGFAALGRSPVHETDDVGSSLSGKRRKSEERREEIQSKIRQAGGSSRRF